MFHRQANANNSLFKYYVCPFFYPEERRERTHFVCAWQIGLLQFNTDIIYCYVCIQICIPSYCKCRSDIQFLFVRCLNLSFFISLEVYWLFFVVWLYWIYVFFECLSVFFQIDSVCLSTCRFFHCLSFCLLNSVCLNVCLSVYDFKRDSPKWTRYVNRSCLIFDNAPPTPYFDRWYGGPNLINR